METLCGPIAFCEGNYCWFPCKWTSNAEKWSFRLSCHDKVVGEVHSNKSNINKLWTQKFFRELICGVLCSRQKYVEIYKGVRDLESHSQPIHNSTGIIIKMFCTSAPYLVNLAGKGDKLTCGQARDWRTHTRTHRHRQRHGGKPPIWRTLLFLPEANLAKYSSNRCFFQPYEV